MDQQRLKSLISYDAQTGHILLLQKTSRRQRVGELLHTKPYINLFGKAYGTLSLLALYLYGDYTKKLITLDGTSNYRLDNLYEVGSLISTPLNQEILQKFLSYDPVSGLFTWKARYTSNITIGAYAGNVQGTLPDAGYVVITILGTNYPAHRLAWLYVHGTFPKQQIDHINHDRTDNRIENLRLADNYTNMKNKSLYTTNNSGYSGILPHGKYYRVSIGVNGTKVHLGVFTSFEEALAARQAAEKLLNYHKNHGQKCLTTIP